MGEGDSASQELTETVKLTRRLLGHFCPNDARAASVCPFCVDFDKDWVGEVVRARILERVHTRMVRERM
jgi:hypothetical protein